MKLILLPYKEKSDGARMISNHLRIDRYTVDADFKPEEPTVALNWGRGDFPRWRRAVKGFINHPSAVMNAIDKGTTLELLHRKGVDGAIDFTYSFSEAREWSRNGHIVFCRRELQGMDGDGIIVARQPSELVDAVMYTKGEQVAAEYRIHVMNGEAFYANRKRKSREKPENPNPDPIVRVSSNGWFFEHLDDIPSKRLGKAAADAVAALGLDFGGVDIGERADGSPVIFEVNTAPEVGPNTAAAYLTAFQKHFGGYKNNENIPIREL